MNQPGEFDNLLTKLRSLLAPRTAYPPILIPGFAQIREAPHPGRLEQQTVRIAEMLFQEMRVHLLDERVEAQVFSLVLSSDRQIDQRMSGPRSRHVELPREPERQRLAHLRRVE